MRLTQAQQKAKQALEDAAKQISYPQYEAQQKDLLTFLEQLSNGVNKEKAALELVQHIKDFGRSFL